MVPVHPQDRVLLGVQWEGQVYVDAVLPFGLQSAPKIFNALADGLKWIAKDHGVEWYTIDSQLQMRFPGKVPMGHPG